VAALVPSHGLVAPRIVARRVRRLGVARQGPSCPRQSREVLPRLGGAAPTPDESLSGRRLRRYETTPSPPRFIAMAPVGATPQFERKWLLERPPKFRLRAPHERSVSVSRSARRPPSPRVQIPEPRILSASPCFKSQFPNPKLKSQVPNPSPSPSSKSRRTPHTPRQSRHR